MLAHCHVFNKTKKTHIEHINNYKTQKYNIARNKNKKKKTKKNSKKTDEERQKYMFSSPAITSTLKQKNKIKIKQKKNCVMSRVLGRRMNLVVLITKIKSVFHLLFLFS